MQNSQQPVTGNDLQTLNATHLSKGVDTFTDGEAYSGDGFGAENQRMNVQQTKKKN